MIQSSRRVALLACGVLVLSGMAITSSASAARRGLFGEIDLRGSNGYHVSIVAHRWTHPRSRGEVSLTVSKNFGISSYTARGRLTRHRLKANLGSFGRIRVRYHPNARPTQAEQLRAVPPSGSLINRYAQQFGGCAVSFDGSDGRFKGRIRFFGEDGYTRIRTRRARGFISAGTESCSKVKRVHGVALDAKSDSVTFEADHLRKQRGAAFLAREREQAGPVTIRRLALGGGRGNSFTYDPGLNSAHVKPIADAFSGSADLASSGAWAGSLAVSFPGAPDVPLAGPGFEARLGRF